ncbi:hypothetical protein H1235_15425 [Pseudoxanthomonas sp. NC8]|nr:hypothetical protein H1235_15425 [Pseudoxanthomonas sp. NC8]
MTSLVSVFAERLYDLPLSEAIRESLYLFPALNVVHVLAIVLLAGTIAIVDLRLIGLALPEVPISGLSRQLLPLTWLGAVLMVVTGLLLFLPWPRGSTPTPRCRPSWPCWCWRRAMRSCLTPRAAPARRVLGHARAPAPACPALAGIASLLLWAAIIVTGRLIAFIV